MPTTINASASSSGLVTTADGSGIVKLQSNGVTTNFLAWGSYNFVAASTIVTLRSSFNLSSMTRNSAGDYSYGFSISMSDANYGCMATSNYGAGQQQMGSYPVSRTVSVTRIYNGYNAGTNGTQALYDFGLDFAIFGN